MELSLALGCAGLKIRTRIGQTQRNLAFQSTARQIQHLAFARQAQLKPDTAPGLSCISIPLLGTHLLHRSGGEVIAFELHR